MKLIDKLAIQIIIVLISIGIGYGWRMHHEYINGALDENGVLIICKDVK